MTVNVEAKNTFSDEESDVLSGLETISLGETRGKYPIDRYVAQEGIKDRIGIIGFPPFDGEFVNIKHAKTHFDEELGSIYCFGSECCERNGLPKGRYIIPIVVYDTDKNGKPISKKFSVQFFRLPQKEYNYFRTLIDEGKDVRNSDFVIICNDSQYQSMTFVESAKSLWQTEEDMKRSVLNKTAELLKHIPNVVARAISRENYRDTYGYSLSVENVTENDLDSLLGN